MGYIFSKFSTFLVSKISLFSVSHSFFLLQFLKFRIITEWSFILGKVVCSVKLYYQCFFVISTHPLQTFPNGSFISYLFSIFFNSKIFSFLQSAAFLCEALSRCFLLCFFLHILNLLEPKCCF